MYDVQQALADGIASLAGAVPSVWAFGTSPFQGIASQLTPDDPRMHGGSDRLFEIKVFTSTLPAVRPKRGDELTRAGVICRITHADHDLTAGISTYTVSVP